MQYKDDFDLLLSYINKAMQAGIIQTLDEAQSIQWARDNIYSVLYNAEENHNKYKALEKERDGLIFEKRVLSEDYKKENNALAKKPDSLKRKIKKPVVRKNN